LDDAVVEAATHALADLVTDAATRKTLSGQPGRQPKVSRHLADRRDLGLRSVVCAIDECHELFQHPKYGKHAPVRATELRMPQTVTPDRRAQPDQTTSRRPRYWTWTTAATTPAPRAALAGERAFALLVGRWRALRHITI
jgi:hypothetical protein